MLGALLILAVMCAGGAFMWRHAKQEAIREAAQTAARDEATRAWVASQAAAVPETGAPIKTTPAAKAASAPVAKKSPAKAKPAAKKKVEDPVICDDRSDDDTIPLITGMVIAESFSEPAYVAPEPETERFSGGGGNYGGGGASESYESPTRNDSPSYDSTPSDSGSSDSGSSYSD
jgi:hypothetical protein